MSSEELSEVF